MPLILGTNSIKDTGYNVDNSLRFERTSTDYLARTPSGAGNRRTFTFSTWLKRADLDINLGIFASGTADNNQTRCRFVDSNNSIFFDNEASGSSNMRFYTTRLFRDVSAWYHIVIAVDTTQATDTNRVKIYINGSQETSFSTANYPAQNLELFVNATNEFRIGREIGSGNFDGYLAETVLIDGTQLDPTSFGEFDEDTGIWKPKDFKDDVTFGTNGFYLDFENSGSLGADVSGNGNNFTVNNLTAIDQSTDTCTNNMPTINILQNYNSQTISEGNTKFITTSNSTVHKQIGTTFGVDTGKWYWEVKGAVAGNDAGIGISSESVLNNPANLTGSDGHIGDDAESWGYFSTSGNIVNNNSGSSYGDTWNTEIIGVALDLDNAKLYFSKSGTWQNSGDPESGATGTGAVSITSGLLYFPATSGYDNGHGVLFNFGSPAFSITSGNSDGNGYGNFEYAVPSGYYSLNSKNLAEYG